MYSFYLRRQALEEQEARRNKVSTYKDPLGGVSDLEEFLLQVSDTVYTHERRLFYIQEQAKYPRLKNHFDMLVPSIISYEDFWLRYEYRTDLNRIMRDLKDSNTATSNSENAQSKAITANPWAGSMGRMTSSFRKQVPEDLASGDCSNHAEDDQKAAIIVEDNSSSPPSNETNTTRTSWSASFGRMRDSFRTMVSDDTPKEESTDMVALTPTSILDDNVSVLTTDAAAAAAAESMGKSPVDQGEEIFLQEEENDDERIISTEGVDEQEVGEEVMLQETASYAQSEDSSFKMTANIHIYPEMIHDHQVIPYDDHSDHQDNKQVETVFGQTEEDIVEEIQAEDDSDDYSSESESSEEATAVGDDDGDNSVDKRELSIFVYPENMNLDNEETQSGRVVKEAEEAAMIFDDEYGSSDDEKKHDDEYGSLASSTSEEKMSATEMDSKVADELTIPIGDMYYDDNLGKKEKNCECACIIS